MSGCVAKIVIAINPISWSVTPGPVLPARAASTPRETQPTTEYEYQKIMAMRANRDSPNPLRVPAMRQLMDSRKERASRHLRGSSTRNGPRRRVRISRGPIRLEYKEVFQHG